jgi:dihydrofolate reductase
MTLLRAYLALSLDGFIADADGGVDWLEPYFSSELEFSTFDSEIGALVMGRRTFDQSVKRGLSELAGRPTVVLTHHPT